MSERRQWPLPRRGKLLKAQRQRAASYFKKKGYPVSPRYPYILADRSNWRENIIFERVSAYIDDLIAERREEKRPFALHDYIHHGLSSQAFLLNLLGPLVVDSQWHILDEILRKAGIPLATGVSHADFELEDREVFNERQAQPTSVDMFLCTSTGEKVFVEFKFTEAEFGGCSVFRDGDCDGRNPANDFSLCYLHHIKRSYWTAMEQHGLLSDRIRNDSQCPFCNLYQAYRLILFALEKNGHFLLIYDERNPAFLVEAYGVHRGLFHRVYESLPKLARDRCHALSVQSVVRIIESHSHLDWVGDLKSMYFD